MIQRLSALWAGLPATTRGIALMLASTLCFSLMHTLIRYLAADLHPIQIALFRNFFGLLVFIPFLLKYGLAPLRTSRPGLHALRAVLNVCAMFAYFTALTLSPLALVTALGFTAPIFAALLAMLLLGESFRLRRWSAIVTGFAGTLIILRPGFQPIDTGTLLVLGSALLWGATLIVIKILGRTDSSLTITAYMNLLLTLLSIVPALFVWRTPELAAWGWLVAVGVLGTLAQFALAQSLKEAETGLVMPFDFFRLIWVTLLGYLLFAEIPGLYTWLGGLLIFAAATYIALRERHLAKQRGAAAAAQEAPKRHK